MTRSEHIVRVGIDMYLAEERAGRDACAVECLLSAHDSFVDCQTLIDQFVCDAQRLEPARGVA